MTSNKPQSIKEPNSILGILFMLLNILSLAALYPTVKFLTSNMSSHQVVFFYKFLILLMLSPFIFKDGIKHLKTSKFHLHALRGFLSVGGSLSFMYGIQYVDLADATAIQYMEQIILVIIGVAVFKEAMNATKVLAIIGSFLGAIIVVYPEMILLEHGGIKINFSAFKNFDYNYFAIILAVIFWSANDTVIKLLGRTERSRTQTFYVTMFSCIFAFPIAFLNWKMEKIAGMHLPMPQDYIPVTSLEFKLEYLYLLLFMAACYWTHLWAFFRSLQYAEISTVVPFRYTKIIFTGAFGYFIFHQVPENSSYIGFAFILASGLILVMSETKKYRKKTREMEQEIENA
jgi:drug/metabolite transporter (DMT)-like permease